MQHQNLYFERISGNNTTHHATYALSRDRIMDISRRLQLFTQHSKPFLQIHYTLRSLARDIDVQAYQLSIFLNHEKQVRFNDYLNQLRIEHCTNLIRNGLVKDLNMKGLALICGFHNRNTLTNAFKKFTGLAPSIYIKYVRKGLLP